MPVYSFRCVVCEAITEDWREPGSAAFVECPECGERAIRYYVAPRVNWGGLKPSDGELHPEVKAHIDNLDRSRDEFAKMHEEHERRTENEE